ncbi:MAG: RNA-processing protein [Candidatus Heimdallarchaeota archaeon]|nr:RNA-processing protein [Candidatus Heimdallarchaeota archaeon]
MSSEFLVRIPLERVAVLIGPKGSTKKKVEELTDSKLVVDSKTGDVIIILEEDSEDPVNMWRARDMVKAIGRGFNPQKAYQIKDSGWGFDLIQLRDFVGTSPNSQKLVRSRVIGKNGRTRNIIEQITGAHVSVFGNTIGIISEFSKLKILKDGLIKLINGSKHSTVYKYLEEQMRELKGNQDKLWLTHGDEEELATVHDLDELERIVFEVEKEDES